MNRYPIDEIQNTLFDLVIIGGGINGCGILRDASERGLKTIIVEKNDFGAGCSSASSRLIHGGLRYLEHFEFDLVRESLREREILLRNAKHLVRPLKLTIPVYRNDARSLNYIRLGMFLYDLLSFDKSLPCHKSYSAKSIKLEEPSLLENDLVGGVTYYDSQVIFPERICLENILLASTCGSIILNHFEVVNFTLSNSLVSSITCRDLLSSTNVVVKGKQFVNVSGPWVDAVNSKLRTNIGSIKQQIGGTKGSHIIVNSFPGAPHSALYVNASDGRPFFIIPWLDKLLIGTTDENYFGNLDSVTCSEAEKYYLINETNRIFKNFKISEADVLYTYSGVRPLPFEPGKSPGDKTRRHVIFDHKSEGLKNFISVIGGKLTTYRSLSEHVVDLVYKKLNIKYSPSKSLIVPFPGCPLVKLSEYIESEILDNPNINKNLILYLINFYGTKYKLVLDMARSDSSLLEPISSFSQTIKAQVLYSIKFEFAYTVSDVIFRRTDLGFTQNFGFDSLTFICDTLKSHYNFSNEEIDSQVFEYQSICDQRKVSRVLR